MPPRLRGGSRCTSWEPSRSSRARIQERVLAGLARARAQGKKLGRPQLRELSADERELVRGFSAREAAKQLGIPRSTFQRWVAQNP